MLKSITIDGFKSVQSRKELRIAPMTVFTGVNSSGKSTVLQTLLLQAQTLQSAVHSASVVLNGHIVRLGKFSDIASAGRVNPITLGFTLVPDSSEDPSDDLGIARQSLLMHLPRIPTIPKGALNEIHCEYSFSGAKEGDDTTKAWDLEPVVCKTVLSAEVAGKKKPKTVSVAVSRHTRSLQERAADLKLNPNEMGRYSGYLQYDVHERGVTNDRMVRAWYIVGGGGRFKPQGAELYHFVPTREVTVFDQAHEFIESFVGFLDFWKGDSGSDRLAIRYLSMFEGDSLAKSTFGKAFWALMRSAVDRVAGAGSLPKKELSILADVSARLARAKDVLLTVVFAKLGKLPRETRTKVISALNDPKDSMRNSLGDAQAPHITAAELEMDPTIAFASAYVRRFFGEHLKYVGPLRDQPRAVYPLSGYVMSERDVGFRGENAAAVLHNFQDWPVDNISPSSIPEDPDSVVRRREPLGEAVDGWLGYLSVAESVNTTDEGTEGHGVYAVPFEGAGKHDLSHVGVGISQVLPIVIESLLAERGSLLLFEQPELHLHPRVQSRLADFFYALTILGKQCIVETHSEYLINRLRYLRARGSGDAVEKSLLIYFTEVGSHGSSFREVHMDQYGAIDEWPHGFFDEGERLASDIARAGLAKSRSGRTHESD